MASPTPADERITVVLIDSTTPEALTRCARQIVRTGETCDLFIVTARHVQLPTSLARRARVTRVDSAEALEPTAASFATTASLVLVAPTSAAFSQGWSSEVRGRAASHDQVISVVGAHGRSVLVFPRAVTSALTTRTLWLDASCLRVRAASTDLLEHRSLSAVMIVKDEEEVLDECLSALAPFVDEIVVYDTGSTDRTVEIARTHGVVLVEGFWNDHFGDARNRALEHATGDWVLQIDADEVITGDAGALRRQLNTEVHDQVSVTILSTSYEGATSGLETQPARFFRRGSYRWTGALHEYPAPVAGAVTTGMSSLHAPVRLIHSGYQPERTASRNKPLRNLALSTKELESTAKSDPARATLLSNQARTLMWAGQVDEALEVFEELRTTPGNPTSIVIAGRAALEALLAREQAEAVEPWLEVLATNGEAPGNIAFYRARRLLLLGDPRGALEAVEAVARDGGGTDVWGTPFDATRIDVIGAAARIGAGDSAGATELLLGLLRTTPDAVPFDLLVRAVSSAGRPLTVAAEVAPDSFLERSLRDAAAQHPLVALLWFEAFVQCRPTDPRPIVAGNVFAARAGWRIALAWASRAAEAGLSGETALHTLAARDTAPLVDRCVAYALLSEGFGLPGAGEAFESLTESLPPELVEELVPQLIEVGIAVSPTASDVQELSVTVPEEVSAR